MTEADGFYKSVLDIVDDGVYFVDRERVITYWNKGAERISGYTDKQVVGLSCRDNLLNHVSADGVELCRDQCPLAAVMFDGQPRQAEVFLRHADGHRVPVLVRAMPLRDAQGEIIGAVETFSSDSAMMSARTELRELRHSLQTDALTGASSREHLTSRLRGVLAEQADGAGAAAGLMFIDVDGFKAFNDAHGHELGDEALRMTARTLSLSLRETDSIGRWGGDEFVVVLPDVGSPDALEALAERSRLLVQRSGLTAGTQRLGISVSIGATLYRPRDTVEDIVQRADALMYLSKSGGRNRVTIG